MPFTESAKTLIVALLIVAAAAAIGAALAELSAVPASSTSPQAKAPVVQTAERGAGES